MTATQAAMGGTGGDPASSWMYIKEGNASFVIGHKTGHVVYRMWKCDPKADPTRNSREAECQIKIDYIRNVLQPVFGRFLHVPVCVPVTAAFVQSVGKSFEGQRPAKRKGKVIDPCQRYVLSQPNFCFLGQGSYATPGKPSTLTVEIKPKLGYIPTNHHHVTPGSEIFGSTCYFCLQQQLKRKEGMWLYTSKYCPVNLFSGNESRMRVALEGLFATPQNNLSIFKDGKIIYPLEKKSLPTEDEQDAVAVAVQSWFGSGGEISQGSRVHFTKRACIQDVITLVIKALSRADTEELTHSKSHALFPWKQCRAGSALACDSASVAAQPGCRLPKGCLLHRLLMAQQLDARGIEFIHRLYSRYRQCMSEDSTADRDALSLEGPYIPGYLHPHPSSVPLCGLEEIPGVAVGECVTLLRGYAVARTARDCSVMVTLRPAGASKETDDSIGEGEFVSVDGRQFQFSCHLIDLDPKSPSKIPQYYKLEQEILAAYLDR